MIIVIADDFSGAAEIGGIAHRFGLHAEVQLDLNTSSAAEVVVLDADTRSMSEEDAVSKTKSIADELFKLKTPFRLFKKVDSVMRGHIAAEIAALSELTYRRAILLPANPGRGRTIKEGSYYIDGVPLNKTPFAEDPEFPVKSSDVSVLTNAKGEYNHINRHKRLPETGMITADIESKGDLQNYLAETGDLDLCCGGAECFETFLEHLGYHSGTGDTSTTKRKYLLVINGSTVKIPGELKPSADHLRILFPGKWEGDRLILKNDWQGNVVNTLNQFSCAFVVIDLPVRRIPGAQRVILNHFEELVRFVSSELKVLDIHFCLTGGATASAIIRGFGIKSLLVVSEIESGVVTLTSNGRHFTVKPGSYPWPQVLLEQINSKV